MSQLGIEGIADFYTEDGGSAAIVEVMEEGQATFVRIQEWNDDPADNTVVPALAGRRVRVTIEVIE